VRGPENETTGVFASGRIIALIDRGDYWQCAWVFAKGEADRVRGEGLDAFRAGIAAVAPMLAGAVEAIGSWDDVKLLTVALDRLEQWHRPGLLVIGDAAHAMSPIGGVGINVAVQDAVAAANIVAGPMASGADPDPILSKVQKRRLPAVRLVQAFQAAAQHRRARPSTQSGRGEGTSPASIVEPLLLAPALSGRLHRLRLPCRARTLAREGQAALTPIFFSRLARIASKNCSVVIQP
jgi:2-polyprenyl-6-methoxyphenol hydroxylase-like FAD-dependent oxidoreductase